MLRHGSDARLCPQEGRLIPEPRHPSDPIRVGLVDDHPSIVAAVASAVREADGLELVGTPASVD